MQRPVSVRKNFDDGSRRMSSPSSSLIIGEYFGDVDLTVWGNGNADAGYSPFGVEHVFAVSWGMQPAVHGQAGEIIGWVAFEEVLADLLPAADVSVFGPFDDAVALTIYVVEKSLACHCLGIAGCELGKPVIPI